MVIGSGVSFLSQRDIPAAAPAPPFAANSAVNGLSVNGAGQIVFGNDIGAALADFISDREIDMAGFLFQFLDGANKKLLINNAANLYQLGDIDGANNSGHITINDAAEFIEIVSSGQTYFQLFSSAVNASQLVIGDGTSTNPAATVYQENPDPRIQHSVSTNAANELVTEELKITAGVPEWNVTSGTALQQLGITANDNLFKIDAQGTFAGNILVADLVNSLFQFGDISGSTNNNTFFSINDAALTAEIRFGLDQYLLIDNTNDIVALGDYTNFIKPVFVTEITGAANRIAYSYAQDALGNLVAYNELGITNGATLPRLLTELTGATRNTRSTLTTDEFAIAETSAGIFNALQVDFINLLYRFGDIDGTGKGNFIEIDDANNVLNITNTLANIGININGVAGFTGTVTPVTTITVNNGIVTNVA